jgi:hypothetical protein
MRASATMLAACLLGSAAYAQTVTAPPGAQLMPLRVFDATGKLMSGTVAEPDSPGPLALTFRYQSSIGTTQGDTFTLRIQAEPSGPQLRYRWAQLANDVFFFESNDCTGQPYVEAPGPLPGRRLALLDYQSNLLYLSEPDPVIVTRTRHSLRQPLQACVVTGPELFQGVAVDPVLDMDDVFTLTFRVG